MNSESVSAADGAHSVRFLKTFIFFLYGVIAVWGPYLTLHYREQGLSGRDIGLLGTVFPFTVIFLPPVWGYVSDRAKDPRMIQLVGVAVSGVALLPCAFGHSFAFFLPFIILFSIFYCPLVPLSDSQIFSAVAAYGGDYGRIRVWGSLGFNFTILAISIVFLFVSDIRLIFVVLFFVVVAALLSLYGAPSLPSRLKHGEYLRGIKLLRNRQFFVLIVGVFINRLTLTPLYTFFSIYLREMDIPLPIIGLIWMIGPFAELAFFHYGDVLLRVFRIKGLVMLSLIAGIVRLFILAGQPPTWVILLSQLLHSLTFAANHLGAVTYVDSYLPPQLRSSGQTIFSAIAIGTGCAIGSYIGGILFDSVGIAVTFGIMGFVT
ncbi:MAG TPA: MFS transporter, partial [bacterium]|nr:MFS transporter [bacterium]